MRPDSAKGMAQRWVDDLHYRAASAQDPVGFLRSALTAAEREWFNSGGRDRLERVRALEASLGGPS